MHISDVAEPDREWDQFVETTPGAGLGHASAWARVVRDAYGLTTDYLAARDDQGALAGVLPLVRIRGLSGRLELVSMPFLDTGGILARSAEASLALREAALDRVRGLRADALELREVAGADADTSGQTRVDLVLGLEASEDAQWQSLRAKVRNQTRKAEKEGLTIASDGADALLAGFYAPFQRNMRDLGSPVHGRRFFEAAAAGFGDRLRFIVTELEGQPVGGLAAFDFAGAVTVPWASTLRSERRRCPNNQIYWEALRWAIARGAREFDFGRSPRDAGTYHFKVGWGAEERPLAWTRWSPSGESLPLASAGDSGLFRRLSTLWQHLPLPVASAIGPRLRRHISS